MELLFYIRVERENFQIEDFESQYDILMLVEKGSFYYDSDQTNGVVSAGEALFYKRNTLYHRKVKEPVILHIFRCSGDSPFPDGVLKFKNQERIASTLRLLNAVADMTFLQKKSFATVLFSDIVNQYIMEQAFFEQTINDKAVEMGVAYLKANCFSGGTVADATKSVGLSLSQFARRFKAELSVTPCEYISDLKMKKAQQLLTDTDLTIKTIAYELGFCNEYYFSSFFKKHSGVSPSLFRETLI